MQVQIVDNVTRDMASVLSAAIQRSRDVRIAVAFASRPGITAIEPAIQRALDAGASIEFLVGTDLQATEPDALDFIYGLSQSSPNVALYCHASLTPAAIYHPKLYLLTSGDDATCIVGSSNLTAGGLKRNVEVNAVIEATTSDEVVSDAYSTYARLKFHPNRVAPDDELLALYAQFREGVRSDRRRAARDPAHGHLAQAFREKVASLRRPTPTRKDLVGWLELVYDSLPDGEFANQQVYAHESEFSDRYPENLNVRAKVRQQLQVLRDMGFVEHLGAGRWRKV